MELWRYYRILRKRKWLIIIGTLVCTGIVMLAMNRRAQKWEAYTTVMESTPDTARVDIYVGNYFPMDPKLRLANLAQLVKSRTVIDRAQATLTELGESTNPEQILATLEVTPLLDTSILVIKVLSDDSKEAQATADIVCRAFIGFYNQMNYGGTARTKEFIRSELPKAEARLNKIRQQIREYKESTGAVALSQQTSTLVQQLSQVEIMLAQYKIGSQQAGAKVKDLESKLSQYPETRTASTVIASNPIWEALQMDLAKQQIELQKMLQTRTDEHIDVKTLKKQIDETERKLAEIGKTILNSTTQSVNPIVDSIQQAYVMSLVDFTSVDAARVAAQGVVGSLESTLSALPAEEERLAQLTLEEDAAKNTYALLRTKLDEATIKEKQAENVSQIQVVDEAKVRPADPRKTIKLILALIFSPIFCAGIAFLLNYLDNTVKTPAEAEELLKLPVFAVVPLARSHSLMDGRHISVIGSSYQMLSTNLMIGHPETEGRTILVASAEPDVGRSTTAANLAITLARDGARVILVDSDLRQPSQHKAFGVSNEKGLSNVLAGQLSLPDALQMTSVNDLLILTSGPLPANPVRSLRSPEMIKFIKAVNESADFVVFDSPAGITFADATLLAALVKNVIIVHAAGSVPRGSEDEFRGRLEQAGANLLGAVLNMARPEDSHGYYHFRSAYEELMRDGKSTAALPGRVVGGIAKDADQDTDAAGHTKT